jgi:hypothetical protein
VSVKNAVLRLEQPGAAFVEFSSRANLHLDSTARRAGPGCGPAHSCYHFRCPRPPVEGDLLNEAGAGEPYRINCDGRLWATVF